MWSLALQSNMLVTPGLFAMFWCDVKVIDDGSEAPQPEKKSDRKTWKLQTKEKSTKKLSSMALYGYLRNYHILIYVITVT